MTIGILGGGLSGITLQRKLNCESEVLEKESRIGGLCRTFEKNRFYYDIGGHILFSKNQQIMDFILNILKNEANYCIRNNKILYKGRYVKYPFENGLHALEKEDIYDCLINYIKNDYPFPNNFLDWIYHTFGSGLANRYLIPYNKKIWKFPLSNMGLEWVERVPRPPMEDVVKSAIGIETEGYTHQLNFIYPREGGIETLVRMIKKEDARAVTNFHIRSIKQINNHWAVSDGETKKEYSKIVITFPLKEVVKCLQNVPTKVQEAIKNLYHNKVRVVLVGINNESLMDKSAIYIPQNDVSFHRICFMGYFSKNNVPQGKSSVVSEITTRNDQVWFDTSDDALIERVIHDLDKLHIIHKRDVETVDIQNIEYGYIIYDANYSNNIKIVREYFSSIGVELLGRSAEFEYINMDETIRRAIVLADKLNSTM